MGGFAPNFLPRQPNFTTGLKKPEPRQTDQNTGGWGALPPSGPIGATGMVPPPRSIDGMTGGTMPPVPPPNPMPDMAQRFRDVGGPMPSQPPQPPVNELGGFGMPPPVPMQRPGMGRRAMDPRTRRRF